MKKWEYFYGGCNRVLDYKARSDLTQGLNDLGADGWELVGFSHSGTAPYFIFKREIP